MKLRRFIRNIISDPSRNLQERVFIMFTFASIVVCALAFLGDVLYADSIVEILTLLFTTVTVPFITLFSVRYGKAKEATIFISFALIFIILPVVFFFGGGTSGALIPWLIFAYLYMGLVLPGRWRIAALITHTILVFIAFTYDYFHPELIDSYSRQVHHLDTFLAVVEVGYVCFIMTWFQNRLFTHENDMAKEETKKVEELGKNQNRFFSNMSHEIRTPINSILGMNEIILRDPDATESIRKDAQSIEGAGRMLLALINDILDFSRIEAGKMDIVPVNYSIASLVSDIVNMVRGRAEEKGLKFNVELDPSIPAELYGDEIRIKQILVNLLNNAVKYTAEGSVTLHIERESTEDDQVVMIFSVSDTGIGIKQDVMPYLYDAFRRMDEGKNAKIEGTGLGLSIVKQLVDLMGGRISVDSIYTQGSTFTVTLRQKIARADAVGAIDIDSYQKSRASKAYKSSFTAPEARVLIVDDSTMNLKVEKKLLEGTRIIVDTVTSGAEALNMTRSERYDVILMDHLMPEMDGIECMQQIRKQAGGLNNRIPIIVLTANAEGENRQLYSQSGFEDYLLKPVTGQQLEEMLLAHLPASKVERDILRDEPGAGMITSKDYSRKIPVIVTCAGTCDLPPRVIKKYQIETIPYTIASDGRTFYDGVETSGDELVRYISEGKKFTCDPPTVEEFRVFFGRCLKYAHNLIYISAASGISPEYARACEAARSYGNVAVIDAECCSTAVGFLILIAQRMATGGETFENIIEQIEKIKKRLVCSFVLDSIYYYSKNRPAREGIAIFMRALGVRAMIRYKNGGFGVDRYVIGDFDRYYKKFIDHLLPAFANPDKEMAVVVYAEMTQEQKDKIEEYLRKTYGFERVLFQRTSCVLPIHMGIYAFSVIFMLEGDYRYNLSKLFEDDEEGIQTQEEDRGTDTGGDAPELADDGQGGGRWYDGLSGIDPAVGLKNTGSEETYLEAAKEFYSSIGDDAEQISRFCKERDWHNYTVKVHALKSKALLIGATLLAEEARLLETAGRNEDADYIDNNNGDMIQHLNGYTEILKVLRDNEPEA